MSPELKTKLAPEKVREISAAHRELKGFTNKEVDALKAEIEADKEGFLRDLRRLKSILLELQDVENPRMKYGIDMADFAERVASFEEIVAQVIGPDMDDLNRQLENLDRAKKVVEFLESKPGIIFNIKYECFSEDEQVSISNIPENPLKGEMYTLASVSGKSLDLDLDEIIYLARANEITFIRPAEVALDDSLDETVEEVAAEPEPFTPKQKSAWEKISKHSLKITAIALAAILVGSVAYSKFFGEDGPEEGIRTEDVDRAPTLEPPSKEVSPESEPPKTMDRDDLLKKISQQREESQSTPAEPAVEEPEKEAEDLETEDKEDSEKYDAVEVNDGSCWRIIPGQGLDSLEYSPSTTGSWEKPPFKMLPMGSGWIAKSKEDGKIKYIILPNKDGNLHQITYPNEKGELTPDDHLTPAPGGVTGALFDVRHAEPYAVVAQAGGGISDLGPPPVPEVAAQIIPGIPFGEEYSAPEKQQELAGYLEKIDNQIKAIQDFIEQEKEHFSDSHQLRIKDDLRKINSLRTNYLVDIANSQVDENDFANFKSYQEIMSSLYERFNLFTKYTADQVRDLREHGKIGEEIDKVQENFILSQDPAEAIQVLDILRSLCQRATSAGYPHSTFRGVKQDDVYRLIGGLEGSGYDDEQLNDLRKWISQESNGVLETYLPQPKEKKKIPQLAEDVQRADFTPADLDELRKELDKGNDNIREDYQHLMELSIQELRTKVSDSKTQMLGLLRDLDNTSADQIYTSIVRRASMRVALNNRVHDLEPSRARQDQGGYYSERRFGSKPHEMSIGLDGIKYWNLRKLSKKAYDNPEEYADLIEVLRKLGDYPPKIVKFKMDAF